MNPPLGPSPATPAETATPAADGIGARLLRLSRMTAVRLSLLYFVVFTLFSVFLVVLVSHDAARIMSDQLHEAIDADVANLEEQYHAGGLMRMLVTLDELGRRPDAGLFYVVDTAGNPIAGNVAELPPAAIADTDDAPHPLDYVRFENGREVGRLALVRTIVLDNGFRVLVGRDLGERDRFRAVVRRAFRAIVVMMILLGGATWLFLSRRVMRRIDQVSATSSRLVAGDLSGRLPVTGSGDEFDRLAVSLNSMLARIAELMGGVKSVSDAIAHDLKTPLTRLRNRAEAALNDPDPDAAHTALEAVIDESNALIRTFDALLMISRVEAGSALSNVAEIDLEALAAEVVDLYEPVAEEAGGTLELVECYQKYVVRGNRELIAQALVNLVDNALKYGRRDGAAPDVKIWIEQNAETVTLSVMDDGPGVPEADRARIFERFTRLEASRNAPGSGLGLALVAAVVRLHKGEIAVEDLAPGLMVSMRLPK